MDDFRIRLMKMLTESGEIVPPANQIWYDAESQATLYASTWVKSHTFSDGRGIVTFDRDLTAVSYAWFRSTNVKKVYLPKEITSIAMDGFRGCTYLSFIDLPNGLTQLYDEAFYDCTSLALTSLPESLTTIGASAFQRNRALALEHLPSGLTRIENSAFNYCNQLRLTSLPNGLTDIGKQAFIACGGIKITTIPSGVTYIGDYAFYSCISIQSLTIPIVSPPTLGGRDVFGSTTFPIYVPAESVETYKAAPNWSYFTSRIFAIPE